MNTRFGRHVMQDLADLSDQEIPGLGINRLAARYGKSIEDRKARERAQASEFRLNVPHAHQVQQRLAQHLADGAARINGKLPVASVYDALQIVKARKDLEKDAGLRALRGHLESMWKRKRTATITASSYLKFHDHYARNFPKSAATDVIVEIGQRGYTTLPRADLHHIASLIETQADYDRQIVKYGLEGPQPHQVKARTYIQALLNGVDDDLPFDEDPESGFEPGEGDEKRPAPKRQRGPRAAQVDGEGGDEREAYRQVRSDMDYDKHFEDVKELIAEDLAGDDTRRYQRSRKLYESLSPEQQAELDDMVDRLYVEEPSEGPPADSPFEVIPREGGRGRRHAWGPPAPLTDEEIGAGEFAGMSSGFHTDIIEGLAHALWSDAWLSGWEEAREDGLVEDVPWPAGAQLEQYIPPEPPAATMEAEAVFAEIKDKNPDVDLNNFVPEGEDPNTFNAIDFGYYLGMEYMGHGVGWSDDHEDHGLEIPYGETPWDLQYEDEDLNKILEQRNLEHTEPKEGHQVQPDAFSARPTGVSDSGLARIAKALRRAQDVGEPGPPVDSPVGGAPIPLSVEKYVSSGSGYLNPPPTLDSPWDLDELFKGQESLTPQEVAQYVVEEYEVDILAGLAPEDLAGLSYRDVIDLMGEYKIAPQGDTTYNWGWWGPDMAFDVVGPSDIEREPYAAGVLLISLGISSTPTAAYKLESVGEESPWYDLSLNIEITTDKGIIRLDASDTEAYYFHVFEDETGTWEENADIDYNDLKKKLDWESSDLHDIW